MNRRLVRAGLVAAAAGVLLASSLPQSRRPAFPLPVAAPESGAVPNFQAIRAEYLDLSGGISGH